MAAMSLPPFKVLADQLLDAVLVAGRLLLAHRAVGARIEHKADGSPVTAADREAEAVLLAAIGQALPGVPVLAEEAESAVGGTRLVSSAGPLVMVDPLDGTREYIAGGDDFTVNIGVAVDGRPAFGMILQPTSGRLFATLGAREAIEADAGAALAASGPVRRLAELSAVHPIRTREPDRGSLRALASRSHNSAQADQFLDRWHVGETRRLGSSLKFCLIAAGEADIYPRFGPTHVWDTCAGHAIVAAAGGVVTTADGAALTYASLVAPFLNPSFIVLGRRDLLDPASPA